MQVPALAASLSGDRGTCPLLPSMNIGHLTQSGHLINLSPIMRLPSEFTDQVGFPGCRAVTGAGRGCWRPRITQVQEPALVLWQIKNCGRVIILEGRCDVRVCRRDVGGSMHGRGCCGIVPYGLAEGAMKPLGILAIVGGGALLFLVHSSDLKPALASGL